MGLHLDARQAAHAMYIATSFYLFFNNVSSTISIGLEMPIVSGFKIPINGQENPIETRKGQLQACKWQDGIGIRQIRYIFVVRQDVFCV